ncbi:hypothetical protein O6H91_13G028300 [Diphasiastrum complanatum]|uniref:Uncharacterized protein n=1 Tax=Diphasiastrum complanatum TaxID=34168 RepID=A0ACC2BTC2_DIPCM|nr:hypothetical protein O6H91_13G028300 [Diphasiastrum complanatum]
MATAAFATAAGAAALYYYARWGSPWRRRSTLNLAEDYDSDDVGESSAIDKHRDTIKKRRGPLKPVRAPSTWFEALATILETLRFTYSETLGKWPIGDLAFGINFLLKRQGHLHVASVYAGEGCQQLQGPAVVIELRDLLRLLNLCYLFSKKPFPIFLGATGYAVDKVLLQEAKAGLLKPAFVVILDDHSESILLIIRGTHSIKDTLTAVTGAVVPFHHTLLDNGGVKNLVLGYAHCGMVAAARWIAQLAKPHLLQALKAHPTYRLKIVGHSLGGGTAALLTYILREHVEFSSAHCVSFAPAACMTWDLAESGKEFVTSVVNGSDLVPTFSAASVDDLRAEVTASAWVNEFREQIERTRILRTVVRSATALGSRLSSIANASRVQAGTSNAIAMWHPVSSGTQVVMRQAQSAALAVVRTRPSLGLGGWSCMGARRRTVSAGSSSQHDVTSSGHLTNDGNALAADELPTSSNFCSNMYREEVDEMIQVLDQNSDSMPSTSMLLANEQPPDQNGTDSEEEDEPYAGQPDPEDIGEEYIWHKLEQEMQRQQEECRLDREEEEKLAREIIKEEEDVMEAAVNMGQECTASSSEQDATCVDMGRFFPPGRVIHIVCPLPVDENVSNSDGESHKSQSGLFETDRALYGKIRLSRTMVLDHYMPTYRRMIEELIDELERELSGLSIDSRHDQEEIQVLEKTC